MAVAGETSEVLPIAAGRTYHHRRLGVNSVRAGATRICVGWDPKVAADPLESRASVLTRQQDPSGMSGILRTFWVRLGVFTRNL